MTPYSLSVKDASRHFGVSTDTLYKWLSSGYLLKYRPPKHLRHTFATLHLAAGENITWVSQMMGHSNAQMTWARYNRFLPNLTREDGSAYERIMNGGE
jgi:integrase